MITRSGWAQPGTVSKWLQNQFGEAVQAVVGETGSGFYALPGGEPDNERAAALAGSPAPSSIPDFVWAALTDRYPAGVIEIDPQTVISPRPAVPYKILPREAGLVELIDSGSIVFSDGLFEITRAIERLPSDMALPESHFLLRSGIDMPAGRLNYPIWLEGTKDCVISGFPCDLIRRR